MKPESPLRAIASLKDLHQHQHDVVEALEAENAPEFYIKKAKWIKLTLKRKLEDMETNNAN